MPDIRPPYLLQETFSELRCCVLIPTYNNARTLEEVIKGVLNYTNNILVVNDGSTDETAAILLRFSELKICTHPRNLGKGMALRNGFKAALENGFHHVITIDSDGQHYPTDFIRFLEEIKKQPGSLIIGARDMMVDNVPGKSTFGNNFSNFWFLVETGIRLPDTQSGFRLYPVERMKNMRFFTNRFEFEIEVIVRAAWKNIPVTSVPVNVFYAKGEERISHFRPGKDFTRISLLNAFLVTLAFLWFRPRRLIRNMSMVNLRLFLYKNFMDPSETPMRKALAVGVGLFFGILPIWGFQLAAAIFAALFFKLNKVVVAISANISVPPMIPLILYGSIKTGELVTGKNVNLKYTGLNLEMLKANAYNFYVYLIGATVLAVATALAGGLLMFVLSNIPLRKETESARS